jgi:hypothetical protein
VPEMQLLGVLWAFFEATSKTSARARVR